MQNNTNLTAKEQETLLLVAKGISNTEIAKRMQISYHTVKAHLESIYMKFNVHNKVQLIVLAFKNNLL